MTIAKTIQIAEQHAAHGRIEAACSILNAAMRAAASSRSQWKLDIAKARILDAAVDATVARSQA